MSVKIARCVSTDKVVHYEFEDEKGLLGFICCGLEDGRAIVDGNVEEVSARCVKAIKAAFNEFLFVMLRSFGYTEVYCETPHKKLISMLADASPEFITYNEATGQPIYKVEI